MPVRADKLYCVSDIQSWKISREQKHKKKKSNDDDKDGLDFWDIVFRRNKAKLAEIELKQKLGELVPRQDVERDNVRKITELKKIGLINLGRSVNGYRKEIEQ